jgi:serine/threonine-protein kinase
MGTAQVAWPFTRIDTGDCDDFVQRWLDWFAAASRRQLQRPSMMPELPVTQNWRRGQVGNPAL